MKEIQHKNKKGFLKSLAYGAVGLAILGGTYIILNNGRTHLKPEDFSKARWIEFYNTNGRIDSCYKKEDISKHLYNWQMYEDEVKKKNKGDLEGRILLPDLDNDGKVGK